jgi:tetratricopeptide (TPR) repeat protein
MASEAAAAREAGRLDDAAALYGKVLARRPGWVEGHWALGTVLYDQSRYPDAREHFRRVVKARPKDGVALALKSLCDVRLGDYDTAFEGLQQARKLGVANASVRAVAAFQLALLVNRSGKHEVAFEMLRGLAEKGTDTPAVVEAFGLVTLRLTLMPDEVAVSKRPMLTLAGRGGYHMARGRRTQIGRMALEELISRFPSEPNVHYAYAVYVAPDDPDLAMAELRRELTRDPAHYPALLQLASLELAKGDAAAALPLAEEGARIAPNVPAAFLVLGRALLETDAAERAVSELEKGAALAPESADLQFALARAYKRVGRSEDAERARQAFVRLDRAAREGKKESGS